MNGENKLNGNSKANGNCSFINPGLGCCPIVKEGRLKWYPPVQDNSLLPQLMVHNSITDDMELFVPLKAKTVSWYVCGPTVYDACHMGHARAYLTFDILRRIMEDYFGYNVLYQVNITDIDDKIILRARQNKLISDYTKESTTASNGTDKYKEVQAYVQAAVDNMKHKLEGKVQTLLEPLPEGSTTKEIEARSTFLEEAKFKLAEFQPVEDKVRSLLQNPDSSIQDLITTSRDALAAQLDKDRGATITDTQIFENHARKFEQEFFEDLKSLNVKEPDVVTRVTQYVPQVVAYIEEIISNGYAYESNGSVYFDTNNFKQKGHDYRKLKPGVDTTAEEMEEGEGALAKGVTEKKHPNDFALWKKSKPGEPSWESTWGPGRPGWHIECSVMASDILGSNIDIHGGGVDLMFPHHDNEMAQAEAYHNCAQWVNYFLHAGHLHIKGLKMSKSLKNFITIRQALQEHTPRQLRMMFLMQPWDKPMNYSDQTVDDAKSKEKYFKNFFGECKALMRKHTGTAAFIVTGEQSWTDGDKALWDALSDTEEKVRKFLLDNFKTYEVIQTLVDLVLDSNKYLTTEPSPKVHVIRKIGVYITKILRMFGLMEGSEEAIGFGESASSNAASSSSSDKETIITPYVDAFVDFRVKVRSAAKGTDGQKEFLTICDDVRDTTLADLGIRVKDTGESSSWLVDDPNAMRKEREEKKRLEAEKALNKLKNKVDQKEKELEKATKGKVNPKEMFKVLPSHKDLWGTYDEKTGLPLTTKDGEPISKSKQNSNKKEQKKQDKEHKNVLKNAGGSEEGIEGYITGIKEEIEKLKLEFKALQEQQQASSES